MQWYQRQEKPLCGVLLHQEDCPAVCGREVTVKLLPVLGVCGDVRCVAHNIDRHEHAQGEQEVNGEHTMFCR